MTLPVITIQLTHPAGSIDLAPFLFWDRPPTISDTIESVGTANTFEVGEVQLEGLDSAALPVTTILRAVTIDSVKNHRVVISSDGLPLFRGLLVPTTVKFSASSRRFSFSCRGEAALLADTDASNIFARSVSGWTTADAIVANSPQLALIVTKSGATSIEFLVGDIISLIVGSGQQEQRTVSFIQPLSSLPGSFTWVIGTSEPWSQSYPTGTEVRLIEGYEHNVPLAQVVTRLFLAAGLAAPTVSLAPLAAASAPFATPIPLTGITGVPLGLVPFRFPVPPFPPAPGEMRRELLTSTDSGVFAQVTPPTSSWISGSFQPHGAPVDWSATGHGYDFLLYGPRSLDRVAITSHHKVYTYERYGYDYSWQPFAPPAQLRRYVLVYTYDTQSGAWTGAIYRETAADGASWSGRTLIRDLGSGQIDIAGPFALDQNRLAASLSCEHVRGTNGNALYFIKMVDTGSGTVQFVFSRLNDPETVTPTLTDLVTDRRGTIAAISSAVLIICQLDGAGGNAPQAYVYDYQFGIAYANVIPLPADLNPYTIKLNDGLWTGVSTYYALSASPENGVRLHTFFSELLFTDSNFPAVQLLGPSFTIGRTDLIVWWDGARPYRGVIPWPMAALFAGSLWVVDVAAPQVIDIVDTKGLSCGDALAELAVLAGAIYYQEPDGSTYFRTRSLAATQSVALPGNPDPVLASMALDDGAGCLDIDTVPVALSAVRYVKVASAADSNVFGEAGDVNYRGTSFGLDLSAHFGRGSATCAALAARILSQLSGSRPPVVVRHRDDGRNYRVGRTFTVASMQPGKTYQVSALERDPTQIVVAVSGVVI